jgi:hypothetical protein
MLKGMEVKFPPKVIFKPEGSYSEILVNLNWSK